MLNESQGFIPEGHSKGILPNPDVEAKVLHVGKPERNSVKEGPGPVSQKGVVQRDTKPRACRQSVAPFDSEKKINVYLRLEYLKNLVVSDKPVDHSVAYDGIGSDGVAGSWNASSGDSDNLPRPGDYVVRVLFMGQQLGHFPCGNVDLPIYGKRSDPSRRKNLDVFISQDTNFCLMFKDLVDNPLQFQLCYGGDVPPESYGNLQSFAYICMDVARLLHFKVGSLSEHIEPWVIPDTTKAAGLTIQLNPSVPVPCLQLSVECYGGLPDSKQFLQGNMMTVLCESVHNLPSYIHQNVNSTDITPDMQVFMTLPFSPTDPVLKFPDGRFKEALYILEQNQKKQSVDQATQTGEDRPFLSTKSIHELVTVIGNQAQLQAAQRQRYWASVKDLSPEIPLEATAMAFDSALDPPDMDDADIYGDGKEDYMEFESGDAKIIWNSVHRKYISVESYRNMLAKLSQNAIWPVEIAVGIRKKPDSPKSNKSRPFDRTKSLLHVQPGTNPPDPQQQPSSSSPDDDEPNERMIMSELDVNFNVPSNAQEFHMIFHGIALVDLSCLVYPGTKSARFACRIQPFSLDLLQKKTCVTESAVPQNLLATLSPKMTAESTRKAQQQKQQQQQLNQSLPPVGLKQRLSVAEKTPEKDTPQGATPTRKSNMTDVKQAVKTGGMEVSGSDAGGPERNPFIVFRICMHRSIVPQYKADEISNVVDEYLPRRQLARRKLPSSSTAQNRYRKAVLEAASELAHEFSEHYWKEVLQNGQSPSDKSPMDPSSFESVKKGFLFYLNASGRYLILREHLRTAISQLVQQKCLNLRPSGFQNHRDFQSYLHDMYVFLIDEMHETLHSTTQQETDPLKSNFDRLLQQTTCGPDEEIPKATLHHRQITDLGIFAEEAFAQGDFETCHKLHLQRICKDKESARCWMEFALMWLSRGDDRMAEIAAREALRKDPLHIYALIISGVIAVKHGDERGLECLGAALGLRPMSPEILVIVGLANNMCGNDVVAEYFFRKAAYVHRIITGQKVEDLERIFTEKNAKRHFNLKEFTKDLNEGVLLKGPTPPVIQEEGSQTLQEEVVDDASNQGADSKRRSKPKLRSSKGGGSNQNMKVKSKSYAVPEEGERRGSKQRKSSSIKDNKVPSKASENGIVIPAPQVQVEAVVQPPLSSFGPQFSFQENLSDILLEEVELPPLVSSIMSPWNITDYSDRMEKLLLFPTRMNKKPSKTGPDPSQISNSSLANSNQGEEGEDEHQGTGSSASDKVKNESTSTFGTATQKSSSRRRSKDNKEKGQGDNNNSRTQNNILSPIKEEREDETSRTIMEKDELSVPDQPRLTNRLGSELIWAANLLVNLRLFDFLDGVLAKQLFFYEKRTLQFVYLRALSLYLRQRETEALSLVREAIDTDDKNGIYWALEGHCHYNLGNIAEATNSYERSLKLPHLNENRHLLYLRYGSLVLDSGKTKLAKRVFLHGVGKYPTPYMWLALGSACFQRTEYDQAESSFSEANRLDSTNPITWGHLCLSSLMQNKQSLAEQSYKWALRFGLKKGILMDEIQRVQKEKGFGDPSFPRVPNCVPHEYYLRRMGKQKPFNIYTEALNQDPPRMGRNRYDDTENEALLKQKLEIMSNAQMQYQGEDEWGGEGEYYPMPMRSTIPVIAEEEEPEPPPAPEPSRKGKLRGRQDTKSMKEKPSASAPQAPEIVTIKPPSGNN